MGSPVSEIDSTILGGHRPQGVHGRTLKSCFPCAQSSRLWYPLLCVHWKM